MATPGRFGPLLETKLYVPKPGRRLVARTRLSERLSLGTESKLTLISAPAGFGKTTVLADWLAAVPTGARAAAWLSLDQADNQSEVFWTYAIAALQTVAPEVGAGALTLLAAPQPPAVETILAMLLNDLGMVPNDVVLVLDDYHVITEHGVHDGMAYLLDHLPPRVHVVIATRADPPLPLGRLRGRGELAEIRAADLRFTQDEAGAYLNQAMGLDLTTEDVAALEGRTEGWIAALQMAALSMQGRDDVAGFIAGFAGDDRYIVDYLVEEVLQRQPEGVRSFLLQTSILGRLSGPLCDAVTGLGGSKTMLEALDRANLFVVPLDDRRRWYRYHHLFADVLQAHLVEEDPGRLAELHGRASEWYGQNGEPSEAIRHALAGEDFERAADLVELAVPAMAQHRQEAALRRWLEALPDEMIRRRPALSVGYAAVLSLFSEFEGVESRLRDAERMLDQATEASGGPNGGSGRRVVVDPAQFASLRGSIALYRAAQAYAIGDVANTMKYARAVVDIVGEDDHLLRGSAAGLIALVLWANGDLEEAHAAYSECVARLEKVGHASDVLGCSVALADIRIAQGRLREAMSTYERGLHLAAGQTPPVLRGTADMHVGVSELLRERNDLGGAMRQLTMSRELGEHMGLPQNAYRWCVAMARIREAEGDLDGAIELLDEAARRYAGDYFPNVRPIAAMKARVWVIQGKYSEALSWVHERGLSVAEEPSYLREFEQITLARLLLARASGTRDEPSLHEVAELLVRLMAAAQAGQRTRSVIEILLLQALVHQRQGDLAAAHEALGRALALAEPEGFVRLFLDEGRPMMALLGAAAKRGIAPDYARELLAAFGRKPAAVQKGLLEPLSERELEVLRLLGTELDGPDIARELVVSLHTVRSHTKSIFAKLGVNNRRAAVRRSEELGLLSRGRDRQPRPIVVHEA